LTVLERKVETVNNQSKKGVEGKTGEHGAGSFLRNTICLFDFIQSHKIKKKARGKESITKGTNGVIVDKNETKNSPTCSLS